MGDLIIEKGAESGNVRNPACETFDIATCMAADNIYVSVNDPNPFPSPTALMNVQFKFDHNSEDAFACEEAGAALVELLDFVVLGAIPEDPKMLGQVEALCLEITGQDLDGP